MICARCSKTVPDGAVYCPWCGKSQTRQRRTKQKRPNGSGSVQPRGNAWEARVVDHYERTDRNRSGLRPVWKTKGGFRTKRDAMAYLPVLIASTPRQHDHPVMTLAENFDRWKEQYAERVSAKTMEGYIGAFRHYSRLHLVKVDAISATDLQSCISDCPAGRRTKQLMKVVANLIFKYCIDDDQIAKNPAANLYVGDDESTHYEPLTEDELARIESSGLPYADYVVALCYLGHRPVEFFGIKKSNYHILDGIAYITGGVKTKAGKDRAVTIPPRIMDIIQRQLETNGTDLLFPRIDHDRSGNPTGYSQMPVRYFNRHIWQPLMAKLGIVGKVPYATRHTYANKIKRLVGDDRDKAGLMGHASYSTTREHYQTTTLAEKQAITDQMD